MGRFVSFWGQQVPARRGLPHTHVNVFGVRKGEVKGGEGSLGQNAPRPKEEVRGDQDRPKTPQDGLKTGQDDLFYVKS